MKKFKITWPDYNKSVTAVMREDLNPDLAAIVWEELPMTSQMGHVVISGESMWCPVKIVHLAKDNKVVRQPGDVYLFASGQSIVITYGSITETAKVSKFAEVLQEDMPTLITMGKIVLEQTVNNAVRSPVKVEVCGIEE